MSLTAVDGVVADRPRVHQPTRVVVTTDYLGQSFAAQYTDKLRQEVIVVYGQLTNGEEGELVPRGRWLPGNWFARSLWLSDNDRAHGGMSIENHFMIDGESHSKQRVISFTWLNTAVQDSDPQIDWAKTMSGLTSALAGPPRPPLTVPELGARMLVGVGNDAAELPICGLVLTPKLYAYQFAPGQSIGGLNAPAALVCGWRERPNQARIIFYPGEQESLDGTYQLV